jgi:phage-related protein
MRPTKCMCFSHFFALLGMATLLWIGSPAIAQSAQPQDRDTTTRQLSSFDGFLDGHPEIAEQLHKNPALVRDQQFVENHPALQDYLQRHPAVREEISENPDAFMRQEQRYDRREDRRELANLDGFLDSHPEIAEQLRKNPSLVNDKQFVKNHPALQEFLQNHSGATQDLRQNPNAFMQEEQRFDQREGGQDREHDMTRAQLASMDQFLGKHPEVAEDLRRNPSLINNPDFVKHSPALQQYLQQNPGVREEFSENPNAFMQREQQFDPQIGRTGVDTDRAEVASMDRFLDSHREIAEQLRKDPSLVNNAKFLHNHPALQTYLQQNPNVHEEIMENPSAFMQQEQGFEGQGHTFNRQAVVQDHDTTRGQMASMDRFLDSHPEIAEQLRKNPSLVNNKDFLKSHQELQTYLQQHPGVNEEFTENPNAFMHQERRFDRQEDFARDRGLELRNHGGFERGEAASFGEFLGTHRAIAAQISKDPNLVNNKEFMETHPELVEFMKAHPTVQAQLQQNPQAFLQSAQQVGKPMPKAPTFKPAQKQPQ